MKYEIGEQKPANLKEYWPGQYDIFSHFEYLSGIPHALFLITTRKENGKANACYHCWSAFSGDSGGFFAVLTGLMQHTHTYKNILREKEFCVNFMPADYDPHCWKTGEKNAEDVDELEIAGLTAEPAKVVNAPRIKEAFLTFECKLEQFSDLSGKGISAMIVGRVVNAAVDKSHKDIAAVCDHFTFYIHAPKDPATGEGEAEAHAKLQTYEVQK
jgi:flavin reductase (DIM6/NTAB) family NADH-FMN oxidoreductase RutF